MKQATPNKEDDFVVILKELRNGQRSIDDFLKELGFEDWLRSRIYVEYDFRVFDRAYDPEDFILECEQKVRQAAPKLEPTSTPNRGAFLGWAKVLVNNTFLDALRKHNKLQKHGLSRSSEPVEMIDTQALDIPFHIAYERKDLLKRFLTFLEDYPEGHRIAVRLRLQDYSSEYSFRDIAEELSKRGIECSYGTARLWVIEVFNDFRVSLGLQPPKK